MQPFKASLAALSTAALFVGASAGVASAEDPEVGSIVTLEKASASGSRSATITYTNNSGQELDCILVIAPEALMLELDEAAGQPDEELTADLEANADDDKGAYEFVENIADTEMVERTYDLPGLTSGTPFEIGAAAICSSDGELVEYVVAIHEEEEAEIPGGSVDLGSLGPSSVAVGSLGSLAGLGS